MTVAAQVWTPEYAASVVEQIEWSLNADAHDHCYEVEDERWQDELGDRPAMYMAFAADGAGSPFMMASHAWAYWSFPAVRELIDKELS